MKIADKSDIQLRWLQDDNETFASWGAWSVFLGLLLEIWFVAEISTGDWVDHSWLALIPDSLIALGVLAEIQFGRRSAAATKELEKRALDRASHAEEALAKFRTTRRDRMRGHEAEISAALKPFPNTPFDTGMALGDGEQADFLWDLVPVLESAGWHHVTWLGPGLPIGQGTTRSISGMVSAKNVEIHLHDSHREELSPAAAVLIEVLTKIGIPALDAGFNASSRTENVIHILIGPRQ